MLKKIKLQNFKCFHSEIEFPLSRLNLLTGINGKGKSSLLQAMLLMKQSVERDEYTDKLYLNGSCVNLGRYEDVKNNRAGKEEEVGLGFEYINRQDETLKLYYQIGKNNEILDLDFNLRSKLNNIQDNIKKTLISDRLLHSEKQSYAYVSNILLSSIENKEANFLASYLGKSSYDAEKEVTRYIVHNTIDIQRLLPHVSELDVNLHEAYEDMHYRGELSIPNYIPPNNGGTLYFYEWDTIKYLAFYTHIHYIAADRLGPQEAYKRIELPRFTHLDKKGENLGTVLEAVQEKEVHKKLQLGDEGSSKELLAQVGYWLSEILDSQVKLILDTESNHHFITLTFEIDGYTYFPANVGFGYSYILPIVISGLMAGGDEILIVENPEAHLHPKAQAQLTQFLARVASAGVQVFVESHSEHILHGLQIVAKEERFSLGKEDINVLYFQDKDEKPSFTKIEIDKDGGIEDWPEGFFDQTNQDYKTLFGF